MDNNRNQDSQDQNLPDPKEQLAAAENYSDQGMTYWEAHGEAIKQTDQPVFEEQLQQSQQNLNQQSNSTQYDQKPYYQPLQPAGGYQQPQKNKLRGLISVITVLIILLVGAGTVYAFRDTLANTYVKATKSPASYYAYIEKNYVEESIERLTPYLENNNINSKIAYDVSSEVTLNKPVVDSLLQSSLGVSLTDLETQLGIPLNSLGLNAFFGSDGHQMSESMTFSLNQVEIITADLFFDMAAKNILVKLPELSNAYLSIDNANINTDNSSLELINKERTADLIKRYSDIVIEHMKQVEQEDNFSLSVGSKTSRCTKLTVTITERELYGLVVDFLTEAKDDPYIIDLLPMFQLTKEEYQTDIEQTLSSLQLSSAKVTDTDYQMDVYVDQKGTIIGREFRPMNSSSAIGYTVLTEKDRSEYIIYLKDDSGAKVFEMNGSQEKEKASYDGKATVVISGAQEYPSMISFDITYEDFRTERKDNISYQYGTVTVSSLELMGLQVMMNFNVDDNIQKSQIVVQMGAEPLVTFDTQINYKKDYEIMAIPADAEIYDINQLEAYTATMDFDEYVAKLSEKLGVDLQSILDNYMTGATTY